MQLLYELSLPISSKCSCTISLFSIEKAWCIPYDMISASSTTKNHTFASNGEIKTWIASTAFGWRNINTTLKSGVFLEFVLSQGSKCRYLKKYVLVVWSNEPYLSLSHLTLDIITSTSERLSIPIDPCQLPSGVLMPQILDRNTNILKLNISIISLNKW